MTGVFFVVCVPTSDHEESLRMKCRLSKSKAHSITTINYFNEDLRADVKRSRSNEEFVAFPSSCPDGGCGEKISPLKLSWCEIKQAVTSKVTPAKKSAALENTIEIAPEVVPLEKVLGAVLEHAKVKDAVWCQGKDNEYYQVFFSVDGGTTCEEVLHLLSFWGVGKEWNSVVSVIPCALYYHGSRNADKEENHNTTQNSNGSVENGQNGHNDHERDGLDGTDKRTAWSRFVSSVRSRLTVAQVVQLIRADAALTFDWLFLLVVSAFVAAIGLVENSTVFLVASMLISPLMGPIMAGTFGTAIRDRDLLKMGVLHELFGLFLALVIGFFFGLIICGIDENYGVGEWPTFEMMSRCDLRSLWVGALIAVPSGAAVAIAVLGDNTASLVGVAISASLLPPAVNAGLLWAMSLIHLIFLDDETKFTTVVKTKIYSTDPVAELAISGTISLCLTLVNIICIYFAGILVYKIKEVAPMNREVLAFWKNETNKAKDMKDEGRHTQGVTRSKTTVDINRTKDVLINNWNYVRARGRSAFHATWSPASFENNHIQRPHLRDIEHYYKENPTNSTHATQHQKEESVIASKSTIQGLFSPGPTTESLKHILGSKRYKHLTEELSPSKSDRSTKTESPPSVGKFLVTPVLKLEEPEVRYEHNIDH